MGVAALGFGGWLLQALAERDSRLPRLALTLESERRQAVAAKLPRALQDLPSRPAVPDAQNAALFYQRAIVELPEWTKEERLSLRRVLDPPWRSEEADQRRLASLLTRSSAAVQLAVEGHRLPHSDFGWKGALTEEDWQERRATLLACDRLAQELQAYALGRRKDPDHALFVLGVIERLTGHITQEQGLLVWQSRTYHTVLAARLLALIAREHPTKAAEVRRALARWHLPPGVLKQTWRLQCVKEQEDAARARKRVYKPENAPFLDYNPLWRELDRVDHQLGWQLYADSTEVIHLRYWRQVQAVLAPLAADDLVGQWKALKALDRAEDVRGKEIPGYWYPLRFGGFAGQFLAAEVTLQLAELELTLQQYKREKGRLPRSLSAQDPFSGKPFIWKEPLLYSVGPDERDDGGSLTNDIVWNLETKTAPVGARGRRSATRRPGHQAGKAE